MTENQKLREALQAISHIDDTTNHSVDASAALDRIGQIARQALALPTAAPVGERLTLSAEDVHAAFVKHFPKTRISQAWIGFAAEIAEAIAARAALSAGDALDAQRYRWLREQHWSNSDICCVDEPKQNVRLGGTCPSGDLLDSAIDAAMRKDKP